MSPRVCLGRGLHRVISGGIFPWASPMQRPASLGPGPGEGEGSPRPDMASLPQYWGSGFRCGLLSRLGQLPDLLCTFIAHPPQPTPTLVGRDISFLTSNAGAPGSCHDADRERRVACLGGCDRRPPPAPARPHLPCWPVTCADRQGDHSYGKAALGCCIAGLPSPLHSSKVPLLPITFPETLIFPTQRH